MCLISRFIILAVLSIYWGVAVSSEEELARSAIPEDAPVQLVKPDFEHLKLQIIEENVDLLNSIEGAVAVVAVVGPFHSGKSFLMNQLMGKSSGFGIGKYVDPKTMGIWMWGKPMLAPSTGENISIVFLDTEGFSSRNVSELYDAKIFAVTSLLSSFLLYNSVKIINQDDLEYLELLARRTRLFALQAQINKGVYHDSFDHDLLSFPPLIWVVQDFVQASKAGESPTDWLNKLVASTMKENQDFDLSLAEIFADLQCHPIFIPSAEKKILEDLSLAKESDLTSDFKADRDALKLRITANIKPKMKYNSPIRGPELAALLRVLVSASNDGSLPEIPGRWKIFLDQLKITSKESCIRFYNSEFAVFKNETGNIALNITVLHLWHLKTLAKAEDLFRKLLLGYNELVEVPLNDLISKLENKYAQENEINLKRINSKCIETKKQQSITAEQMMGDLELPQRMEEMREYIEFVKRKCKKDYWAVVNYLSDVTDVRNISNDLVVAIEEIADLSVKENLRTISELYDTAKQRGISEFRSSTEFKDNEPMISRELKRVSDLAILQAKKAAETYADPSLDKGSYKKFLEELQESLEKEVITLKDKNLVILSSKCLEVISSLKLQYIAATGSDHIQLPLFEESLTARLNLEENKIYREYTDHFNQFTEFKEVGELRDKLEQEIKQLEGQRVQENLDALAKAVSIPLSNAISIVKLSAAKYDTVWEFRSFVLRVCSVELEKGKAKEWSEEMRYKINHYLYFFIHNSPEKKPTSGRINASDPNIAAQLEEMSNDPGIVTERLKKVAEVLSAWPKKYEAAIQGKARKLHESVMHANQDLGFLKDELQKARMSLQSSQTDNHDLKGELQVLREENQAMRQGGNAPTESFFSNEETQLLIADLRNEIVALKSEVPDPNLCDSLRLMIQLLEEDKRTVQNKYTQVNEELHSRDNEISRLMRDHEASGNFIQEGRIGLEKQFNSQLAELRRQNNTLSQQLDYSNQKLEMSQRRDATENEPGPSRVELMGVVETANKFNDQLQLKVHEKEDEITRLKKLLESSREILTSSSTSNQTYSQSESETRTKDEIVFLRIQIKNLEREVEELRQNQFVKPKSDGRLENDLAEARERVKKCEGVIHDREMQIRMLQNNEKEDLIGTLLQEKDTLTQQLDDLKVEIDSQKPMKEKVLVLTNWLEGRDKLIQRLNDTISHLKNEAGIYQRNTEEYDRRSQEQAEYGNRWRQEASKSEQTMLWYKSKVQELEVRLAKAPSMDTAKEVYDVMVESMTRDMNALRVEKEKVESVYKAQCDHVQKLQQSLKDLSVECAELKNQRQVYGPHQCFDIGSGAPRYPDPQTPSSGAQRELVQGRDTGVKYPPH
ncbi:Guanylate-binding protein 1-like [Oopsacas minuta]|uniref:Guanylate-binding protein 1-like n=1 Tax=Oopsacas minuta TaxID=111878 RepID=A0AAV7KJQ7_9METZ|nr:Guanylate-binding protein 1-like [Oopsacas minuta]